MIDGLWIVEFISSLHRSGKGVIVLNKGRLLGGDGGYYYSGDYEFAKNRITGTAEVIRYDRNSVSVFGDADQFTLNLEGEIEVEDYSFNAVASIKDCPDYRIQIKGLKRINL